MIKVDNKDTLKNLIKYAQEDFKGTINTFEDFEVALEKHIKTCGRSIEDQKLEAISVLTEKKNDKSSERIAIGLAFGSIAFSIFSNGLEKIALIIISAILIIGIVLFMAFRFQIKNSKIVTYYTIKLHCIERIEAQVKSANNVCSGDGAKKATCL